jgi:lactate dehydrogenase-like 2-hydroxyacid dehydrogenase
MSDTAAKPGLLVIGPYAEDELTALAGHFTVHRLWEAADKDALLRQVAPGIQAVGTRGELGASAELMAMLPNLGIVACFGVGTDAIDLAYARSRGIRVTNTPDVLTEDVADLGWALLLATARRVPTGDAHVRSGAWATRGAMALTTRVWGKRLGIVGLGRIGCAVARWRGARRASACASPIAVARARPMSTFPGIPIPSRWHAAPTCWSSAPRVAPGRRA